MKYKQCPKCKTKLEVKDTLFAEQNFTTTIKIEINPNTGEKEYIDMYAGYTLLDEYVDNMLVEKGKPKIIGCNNCL